MTTGTPAQNDHHEAVDTHQQSENSHEPPTIGDHEEPLKPFGFGLIIVVVPVGFLALVLLSLIVFSSIQFH